MLHDEILNYTRSQISRDLFIEYQDRIFAGFLKAYKITRDNLERLPPTRPQPQIRHYWVQDALATLPGTSTEIRKAPYRGENYVTVTAGNVCLTHSIIRWKSGKHVRQAKHRSQLSLINQPLDARQLSLFGWNLEWDKDIDQLYAAVVSLAPSPCGDQSRPAEVFFVVPWTNWRGYHLWIPMDAVLVSYAEESPYDGAWPKLRAQLRRAENEKRQDDEN